MRECEVKRGGGGGGGSRSEKLETLFRDNR